MLEVLTEKFYIEELPVVLLRAIDQYIKQLFYTIIVLPDDRLIIG
jgi:hypothetical protein